MLSKHTFRICALEVATTCEVFFVTPGHAFELDVTYAFHGLPSFVDFILCRFEMLDEKHMFRRC